MAKPESFQLTSDELPGKDLFLIKQGWGYELDLITKLLLDKKSDFEYTVKVVTQAALCPDAWIHSAITNTA